LIQAGEKTKRREIQRQSFRSKDDCMSLLFWNNYGEYIGGQR
jgi:hypothetical protein